MRGAALALLSIDADADADADADMVANQDATCSAMKPSSDAAEVRVLPSPPALPADWPNDGIEAYVLEHAPRLALDCSGLEIRRGGIFAEPKLAELGTQVHYVHILLRQAKLTTVGLSADRNFATGLVSGLLELDVEDLDEDLIDDGLGEFLNLLVGATKTAFQGPDNQDWSRGTS